MEYILISFAIFVLLYLLLGTCFITACIYGYKFAKFNYESKKHKTILAISLICFILIVMAWPGNIIQTESGHVFTDTVKLLIPLTAITVSLYGIHRFGMKSCFSWLLAYGFFALITPMFWLIDIFSRIFAGYNIIYMQRPPKFKFIHTYHGEITLLSSLFFILAVLSAYAFINEHSNRISGSESQLRDK